VAEVFETFCERCGTRQVHQPEPASSPLAGRILRGLLGTEKSDLDEGAGVPSEGEPFLRLCLACRGYNCPVCWNDEAGFCQECVPLPGAETLVAQASADAAAPTDAEPAATIDAVADDVAHWPAGDLVGQATESVAEPQPVVTADAEPEPVVAAADVPDISAILDLPAISDLLGLQPKPTPEPEPIVVAEPEPEPEPVVAAEPEPIVDTEPEPEPIVVAEPEPEPVVVAEPEPKPEPEPVVAVEPEPEPEPEPVVAVEPEPEPEPVVVAEPEPEPEPEPVVAVEPEPAVPPIPVWPLPQPDQPIVPPVIPTPPTPPQVQLSATSPHVAPQATPPPTLPPASQLPPSQPPHPPVFRAAASSPATRAPLPQGLLDGPPPQTRECNSCQLPLSARSRFCRRCGTAQALPH
jgi:hypothetical protein